MTKTRTDSNQVSIHQHQDYTVKWRQIQNGKQKWIVIKQSFLVEIVTESDKRGLLTHFIIFELLVSCD